MGFKEWRNKYRSSYPDDIAQDAWRAATIAERERCAKIVESTAVGEHPSDVAQVIRIGKP